MDGKRVADTKVPHTIPFLMTIGVDLRTPVDDGDYQVPFHFTGVLYKLTVKLGPERVTADDRPTLDEALARAHD